MYTSTTRTVLGEFSELQYSLAPSYQSARLLVPLAHSRGWYMPQGRAIMHNANGSQRSCNLELCMSVKFQPYLEEKKNFIISTSSSIRFFQKIVSVKCY